MAKTKTNSKEPVRLGPDGQPILNTITDLNEHIDFSRMAKAMRTKPNTLHKRLERGSPELSPSEKKRLKSYLLEVYAMLGLIINR